jgi:hypothetical protein
MRLRFSEWPGIDRKLDLDIYGYKNKKYLIDLPCLFSSVAPLFPILSLFLTSSWNKKNALSNGHFLAEREGFEPSIPLPV